MNILNKTKDALEKSIISILNKEPYFAEVLLRLNKVITTKYSTLGVCVKESVYLYINPYFFYNADEETRKEYLKHEVYHLLNNHVVRMLELEPELKNKNIDFADVLSKNKKARRFNMAADVAINQFLKGFPNTSIIYDEKGNPILDPKTNEIAKVELCTLENLKKHIPQASAEKETEYYYELLNKKEKEGGGEDEKGNGKGQGNEQGEGSPDDMETVDDHSVWFEGETNEELIKKKIQEIANDAAQAVGASNIPGDIKKLINALNYTPKNWKSDLQQFVARASKFEKLYTRKRRNRRYGLMYPGSKKDYKLNIVVVIDTSGSTFSNDIMGQFSAEIHKIHNSGVNVTIIECDTEVKRVYQYDGKMNISFEGGGGTAFQPAFNKAEKIKPDGLIYLTDGYNFDSNAMVKPKFPVLWALLKDCKKPVEWGSETLVEIKQKA